MKVSVATSLFAVVSAFLCGEAGAADFSLANLRAICESANPIDGRVCQFYIFGVSEGIILGRQTASTPNAFCLPDGLDAKEMAAKVQEMMGLVGSGSDNLPAASMVGAALNNAYPCPKSK